jgi:hypothetical protein
VSKKEKPFPRSLVLHSHDMQPDLPTAFKRWIDLGELPANARLGEFLGRGSLGDLTRFRDVCTGDVFEAGEEWETIADVQLAKVKGKPTRQYVILRNPA